MRYGNDQMIERPKGRRRGGRMNQGGRKCRQGECGGRKRGKGRGERGGEKENGEEKRMKENS